jgi:hypothetical protein
MSKEVQEALENAIAGSGRLIRVLLPGSPVTAKTAPDQMMKGAQ